MPSDLRALRRDNALQRQAGRWVQAEGLLDDGIQVRQVLALLPGDQARVVVAEHATAARVIDFLPEALERRRVAEEVVEDGAEGDGRGLGAREGHGHRHGLDERLVHEVRAAFLRDEEFREEVQRGLLLLGRRGWEDGAILLEAGDPLGHACPGEFGNGEGGVQYSPVGQLEINGILQ